MDAPILLKPGGDPEQQWLKRIATFLGLILGTRAHTVSASLVSDTRC